MTRVACPKRLLIYTLIKRNIVFLATFAINYNNKKIVTRSVQYENYSGQQYTCPVRIQG